MNSYTIQSIDLWLRRHGAHEDENVMDLSMQMNQSVARLIEDENIEGMLEYRLIYTDGTTQSIKHDFKETVETCYRPLLLTFVERYKDIIEWCTGLDFRTGQRIEYDDTGERVAYGKIHDMAFVISSLLRNDLVNTEALIKEGYYFDKLLEKWIDVEASRNALAPLILNLVYLENLKANSRAIRHIDTEFEDHQTGLTRPLAVVLKEYGDHFDFYDDDSISGWVHVHVTYEDGSTETITTDKSEEFDDRKASFVDCFTHYWLVLYEYEYKRDFWTDEPFLCYSSYYDYACITFDEEDWEFLGTRSRERIEARFGKGPYDMSESSDKQFMLNHYYGFMGTKAELEEGYYFDGQLKRWVNVKDSYKAIQAFAKTMQSA